MNFQCPENLVPQLAVNMAMGIDNSAQSAAPGTGGTGGAHGVVSASGTNVVATRNDSFDEVQACVGAGGDERECIHGTEPEPDEDGCEPQLEDDDAGAPDDSVPLSAEELEDIDDLNACIEEYRRSEAQWQPGTEES